MTLTPEAIKVRYAYLSLISVRIAYSTGLQTYRLVAAVTPTW